MYGIDVHKGFRNVKPDGVPLDVDVIGEVTTSPAGNLVLRIGQTVDEVGSWTGTAHVVLTPAERRRLIFELVEQENDASQ